MPIENRDQLQRFENQVVFFDGFWEDGQLVDEQHMDCCITKMKVGLRRQRLPSTSKPLMYITAGCAPPEVRTAALSLIPGLWHRQGWLVSPL